jgi:acyl carrier protein
MKDQIRNVTREHGHLSVDLDTLPDEADLYQAGITSHASERIHATDASLLLIVKEV